MAREWTLGRYMLGRNVRLERCAWYGVWCCMLRVEVVMVSTRRKLASFFTSLRNLECFNRIFLELISSNEMICNVLITISSR